MDIYLCIGQSNMAGRATIENQDLDSLENVFLFNGNDGFPWEKAANPMNKYSTIRKNLSMQKLSPSYYFAKEMSMLNSARKIGLVVNAKGGSSITEWEPNDPFYIDAINRAQFAMNYGEIKGIIWHQGESDASDYDEYIPKISALIASFRKDLNRPNLPFVVGQLSPDNPSRIPFNKMILELPSEVENTAVVTVENTSTVDDTHFDSESQRKLGKRYAAEMVKLLK
ncbi:sialate O-acetylesterase [Portibacter lacus]|uniref:Acetylxylan esterase n=1 Tax=Portibacter lacus TaxID=1099794 RepID=A0AA37SWB4_9BACT|nr:sialate O-acetylesterase [Portibacter lacus]GLR19986.1 acetylxylan esterase [Portibacter lacus]